MPVYNEKNKNKWTKKGEHYYFRCYYVDSYGKRRQKQSKMYMSSALAKEAERKFLEVTSVTNESPTKIKFDTVFYEWLDVKKMQIKPSTFYGVKHKTIKYILNYFSGSTLKDICLPQITEWSNALWNNGNSIDYNNVIITYAKEIFSFGRDNYGIDAKVIGRLQKKKNANVKSKIKDSEHNFWTPEEFSTFIQVVDNKLYSLMFTFLYYTGLRLGEMIALTWNDVDFQRQTISINKSFTNKCEEETYIITSPKTNNSVRIVDIDDKLMNLLKEYYKEESKVYNFNNDVFIFGNYVHISPTTFKNHLDRYITIAGVKRITPHGFRHSHVSLLIHLGCDSREVANRVGDTIQVIENTYYHMFPQKKNHTVSVLNNIKL